MGDSLDLTLHTDPGRDIGLFVQGWVECVLHGRRLPKEDRVSQRWIGAHKSCLLQTLFLSPLEQSQSLGFN